jgi:hypothetical protein
MNHQVGEHITICLVFPRSFNVGGCPPKLLKCHAVASVSFFMVLLFYFLLYIYILFFLLIDAKRVRCIYSNRWLGIASEKLRSKNRHRSVLPHCTVLTKSWVIKSRPLFYYINNVMTLQAFISLPSFNIWSFLNYFLM